ncbi:glycoside hydrolase family 3 protein [Streptomyces albidus (ex Kaewkla and Franco 2022)]|uniref:glycoside hydrolase family 3 protein n=1 Tax=Streptomyces albidus (ex Kaewkla and Franco 2022) TaxID=722709 RepID=UPI0015EF96E2|nr:glycoside hydrolase family 3 protein [Streptomyces albidus (ex Kaewkla and Franco 2022)]
MQQTPPHQSTTRRQILAGAAGVAAAFGLSSGTAQAAAADARTQREARTLLGRMSLKEKIGQLFVVEVYGTTAATSHAKNKELYGVSTPAEVIAKYRPGGVIYFDARRGPDNLKDPRQVAGLSNGLQRAALRTGARIPLLVSIDQEGGSVVYRMLEPATQLPGNMALAAGRSSDDVRRSAEIIGTELAAMGINQNYAPVADVNINPDNPIIGVRSFGSDPELCSRLVSDSVRGYHRGEVASAAKHFPGHGDTDVDSHSGLPVIKHTREQLDTIDLPPFRAAIARGVDTIMTAHIVVPSLDSSEVPATMSKPIVTGLLREELGFRGLIVTDALDMGGATEDFPPDVAPVRALKAGCDQLVLAPKADTAHAAVLKAVESGDVPESRLDASVLRILEHKIRNGLFPRPYVDEKRAERVVGNKRHAADAARITDRTVTLVRNEGKVLPLSGGDHSVLVTGWGATQVADLTAAVETRSGQSATALETGAAPTQVKIDEAVAAAADHDVTVVLTNAAASAADKGAAQASLVKALMKTGTSVIAVAVRNAYDIRRFPDVPAYLATFSYGKLSVASVVDALYGDLAPAGKLPVAIPALDDPDKTLYEFGHGLGY